MFDSGVRGASDVFKALALGAKFVFVGRLWVWGLSIMGEHGVRHVMKSLLADFDILLNVAGFQNIDQINKDALGESAPLCQLRHRIADARQKHLRRDRAIRSSRRNPSYRRQAVASSPQSNDELATMGAGAMLVRHGDGRWIN